MVVNDIISGVNFVSKPIDFCQTPVLGLRLGVDFTFAWDNKNTNKNNKNPHPKFFERNGLGFKG